MAIYFSEGIEEGRLSYLAVFSIPKYTQFKESVDAMLVADGFQDLIVPIPAV